MGERYPSVTFRLSAAERSLLDALAAAEGLTVSEAVRLRLFGPPAPPPTGDDLPRLALERLARLRAP